MNPDKHLSEQKIQKATLKLLKQLALIALCAGIATHIGPQNAPIIKGLIGATLACALLGTKLPRALNDLFKAIDEQEEENAN